MAEVDRLSTSGTYPALPMAGKRRSREESRNPVNGARRAVAGTSARRRLPVPRQPGLQIH